MKLLSYILTIHAFSSAYAADYKEGDEVRSVLPHHVASHNEERVNSIAETKNGIVSVYKISRPQDQESYYCVTLSQNMGEKDDFLSVALVPSADETRYCLFSKTFGKILELQEQDMTYGELIQSWEIPSKFVKDALESVRMDINLLQNEEISIQYATNKVVKSGADLAYDNKSYIECVLEFASIIPTKEKEGTSLRQRFINLRSKANTLTFDEKIKDYKFNKKFSYMHIGDEPSTLFTLGSK